MSVAVDGKSLYQAAAFETDGLAGATAVGRLAGSTASGAPGSGTFDTGDLVIDQSGKLQVCTAGGSPGTWSAVGGAASSLTAPASVTGTLTTGQTGLNVNVTNSGSISSETPLFNVAGTTLTLTGAYSPQRFSRFMQPTLSGNFAVATVATLYIDNSVTLAGGATSTNNFALYVGGGTSFFTNDLSFSTSTLKWATGGGVISGNPASGTLGLRVTSPYTTAVSANTPILGTDGPTLKVAAGYTTQGFLNWQQPGITDNGSSVTVTNVATHIIQGAPIVSGLVTATNLWAFWVQAGTSRFDGLVDINQSIALGGGAAPTFGTIGGSGPATAAQNSWLKVLIGGTSSFIPIWR